MQLVPDGIEGLRSQTPEDGEKRGSRPKASIHPPRANQPLTCRVELRMHEVRTRPVGCLVCFHEAHSPHLA